MNMVLPFTIFFWLLFNQRSRSRCFSGILLLSLWSGEWGQFDHWFLCFSYFSFFPLEDNCFPILYWPLPYINMNRPQIYICPLLPRPLSHPIPSRVGLSSLWHTANSHLLSTLHMVMYVSMLLSQFVPPSSSPTVSFSLFFMSTSPLLPCT